MNPYHAMREKLLEHGLSARFSLLEFAPAAERPVLIDLDEIDEMAYKDALVDIVAEATDKQTIDPDYLLFDEALMLAAESLLNEVQFQGMKEALRVTDAPLTPEVIVTYMLSTEVFEQPPCFRFGYEPSRRDETGHPAEVAAATVLFPQDFDIVGRDGESTDELIERSVQVLRLILAAREAIKIDLDNDKTSR